MNRLLYSVSVYVAYFCTQMVSYSGIPPEEASDKRGVLKGKNDYFLELDSVKQDELLRRLESVRLGDTYAAVVKKLGTPTYDQRLVRKDGNVHSRVLSYYVKKWRKDVVNEKYDQLVRLAFNQSNILIDIKSTVTK